MQRLCQTLYIIDLKQINKILPYQQVNLNASFVGLNKCVRLNCMQNLYVLSIYTQGLIFIKTTHMHTYHAHIYFTLPQSAMASSVLGHIAQAIPQLSYVGRLIPMPIGPHPLPMVEIHIPADILTSAIEKIAVLREGLSVLIHPVQYDELAAHSSQALWLGEKLVLNLSFFNNNTS